jgi:hypothetical protein
MPLTCQHNFIITEKSTIRIMPFSTDTNWPEDLLKIFNVCRGQNTLMMPFEARYYGPYDRLLNYAMVEDTFAFFLAPQTPPDDNSLCYTKDLVVFFVVFDQQQKPVLFAVIKDDGWATTPVMRQKADTLMRHVYDDMLDDCPIPRLYGLSLLGTSLCVYCCDKDTLMVTPRLVCRPDVNRTLPCDFLGEQWRLDILSQDGLKKIQEIVAYIKTEASNVMGQ